MKRPYKILLVALAVVATVVLVVVANVSRLQGQVDGIEVQIRYGRVPRLVDEQDVRDSVLTAIPGLMSMRVKDVDREAVAEAASRVPYLRDAYAAVSVSGKIVVKATQRRPIARLFHSGREFYFDGDGTIMPASKLGGVSVVVASGDFTQPLRADSLDAQVQSLVDVARFLDGEKKYRGIVDQLYVERDGDIVMVPKLGDHIVELGPAEDLAGKFGNLVAFYREGMPRAGWNTYSKISLKWNGQVVCTK